EEVGGGAPRLRVRGAHERVADQADAERGLAGGHRISGRRRGGVAGRASGDPTGDGQDSNAFSMNSSTLSLVTTGALSMIRRGTPCEVRSDMLLPWAISRASLMPSAACVCG